MTDAEYHAEGSGQGNAAVGGIIEDLFRPLIAPAHHGTPGKAVGIIVGVTLYGEKQRYYFRYGAMPPYPGGTAPAIKDEVLFIGSTSKVFTATLLALAQVQRNWPTPVDVNTEVAALLPTGSSIQQPDGPIRLWHLATHSAGFPEGVCGPHRFGNYPFQQMHDFLADFTPAYPPGHYWSYSNQAFALLGDLLSHAWVGDSSRGWDASYQQWPSLVVTEVASALGMAATQVAYAPVAARVAQGYVYAGPGEPYRPVAPPTWALASAGLGAGALSSTAGDLLTFLEAQMGAASGAVAEAIWLTQQPWPSTNPLSMGLGWQLGNGYLDKDGGLAGYDSYVAFDPAAQVGLVVLANTSAGGATPAIGGALDGAGRRALGRLRGSPALPSRFPQPPAPPSCPGGDA